MKLSGVKMTVTMAKASAARPTSMLIGVSSMLAYVRCKLRKDSIVFSTRSASLCILLIRAVYWSRDPRARMTFFHLKRSGSFFRLLFPP